MIDIENLVKKYNDRTSIEQVVLDGCNLNIRKGEKIVITGENGSGKSTLLKIIGLLDRKYLGNYKVNEIEITQMNAKQIAKLRNETFGFVFQEYNLLEEESAYDNIMIPLLYSDKYKRRDRKQRIEEVVQYLEISDILKKKVKLFSGGERQKIAIARAIVNNPDVIILDEPTNALNERMKLKALHYIENYVKEDKTLILVTHDNIVIQHILNKGKYGHYLLKGGKLLKSE